MHIYAAFARRVQPPTHFLLSDKQSTGVLRTLSQLQRPLLSMTTMTRRLPAAQIRPRFPDTKNTDHNNTTGATACSPRDRPAYPRANTDDHRSFSRDAGMERSYSRCLRWVSLQLLSLRIQPHEISFMQIFLMDALENIPSLSNSLASSTYPQHFITLTRNSQFKPNTSAECGHEYKSV